MLPPYLYFVIYSPRREIFGWKTSLSQVQQECKYKGAWQISSKIQLQMALYPKDYIPIYLKLS